MSRIFGCASALVFFGMSLNSAMASEPNSWVSGTGTDSGTCTITAPCATLQYALKQTVSGGTINIATSGSFGQLIIQRPMNVVAAEGVDAVIQVAANGVGVYDQTTGVVLLKGLHITGTSINGNVGVGSTANGHLILDHLTVTNLDVGVSVNAGFALIKSSVIVGNTNGVTNENTGLYVGQTTVSGNVIGITGVMNSYGDNDLNGNTYCDICQASITEVAHDQ